MQGVPTTAPNAGNHGNDNNNDDGGGGTRTDQSEAVPLTDALPAEMLCKIVAFFRAHPSQWMALLLTSRAVAAAARTVLDPASDRVRSGANARAPTMAARLVAQYADAVPRVLDAYRCANASAVLVEACRAGNIALMRTLIVERARWRVDVAYRHNRALLECVRLHSAVGVQLLLATGEVDPTDYPGAAHAGRCAVHDGPACRRPDHPEPCGPCARGQQHGPWSDSDTDDEVDDGENGDDYEAYIDLVDHSDPLADTDEEEDAAHGEGDSWTRQRRAADIVGVDQHIGARSQSAVTMADDVVITAMFAPGDGDEDDDDNNHFGVDYEALFEHEMVPNDGGHGAGVYSAVAHRTSRRDAWSLDGGDDASDYDGRGRAHDNAEGEHGHERGADLPNPGASQGVSRAPTRRPAMANSPVGSDVPHHGDPLSVGPYAHVYASISRDGAFSDDGSDGDVDCQDHYHGDDGDDTNDGDGDDGDDDEDYYCDESDREQNRDQNKGGARSWSMGTRTATTSDRQNDTPEPTSSGHALAIRRAHLAQCICRRGMAFAIVWIDSDGREIGGRADERTADPLWFLVCDDPSALVADGPLSFLMNGGRARDLTPTHGAAFVSSDNETRNDADPLRDTAIDAASARDNDTVAETGSSVITDETNGATDNDDHGGNVAENRQDADKGDGKGTSADAIGGRTTAIAGDHEHRDGGHRDDDSHDQGQGESHRTVGIVARSMGADAARRLAQPACTCESQGRVAYSRAMERWCPLFWAALMSVGVLGQLLGHMAAQPPEARRWACRFQDVLAMAASQIIVFSSASRMEALSDVHAAALDLALTSGGIDLAVHGDFLVAFAADRGCSDVVEMLVEYDAVDAGAHGDLALRRALWRYVRLYRPIQGAGAHLEPEERLNRMALYGATLIALAAAIGLDTGGMEPADAHMEPIDEGFVRSLARRVYPGLTPNDIGRLRLPPLRPHYPPPFARP